MTATRTSKFSRCATRRCSWTVGSARGPASRQVVRWSRVLPLIGWGCGPGAVFVVGDLARAGERDAGGHREDLQGADLPAAAGQNPPARPVRTVRSVPTE